MSVQPASVMGHSKDATGTRPRQGTRACPDRVPEGTHAEPIEVPTKTRTRHTGGHTSRAVSHVCPARARPGLNQDAKGAASAGNIRAGCVLNLEPVRCLHLEPQGPPATADNQSRRPFEARHQRHRCVSAEGRTRTPRWGLLISPEPDGSEPGYLIFARPPTVSRGRRPAIGKWSISSTHDRSEPVCSKSAIRWHRPVSDRCEILATQRRISRGSQCWSNGVDGDAYRYTRCRSWSRHRCNGGTRF